MLQQVGGRCTTECTRATGTVDAGPIAHRAPSAGITRVRFQGTVSTPQSRSTPGGQRRRSNRRDAARASPGTELIHGHPCRLTSVRGASTLSPLVPGANVAHRIVPSPQTDRRMTITRRALLQLAGLSLLPALAQADDAALDAWAAKIHAATSQPRGPGLTADERALVASMVDGILPRTDTPGALDVGVPAFIDVIVADWLTDAERREFRTGLAALEARAQAAYGVRWAAMDPVQRDGELAWAERPEDAAHVAKKAYRRIKGLALHGYLTSERVRKEVLKVNITPGHFRGAVPITVVPSTGGHAHA